MTMFENKKSKHDVFVIDFTRDEYNQKIPSPIFYKAVAMLIGVMQHNQYTSNDTRLLEVTHTAITEDRTIQKGMVIDDKYIVEFANNQGKQSLLYLKEMV